MLLISELVRFGRLLDDAWHSRVADAAAVVWAADRPVFLRSSASHVLVAGRSVPHRRWCGAELRHRPGHRLQPGLQRLGARLAHLLRPGDLVIASGDLGAGKTTLTQGIGRGLGSAGPIISPTFVLS